MPNSGTASYSGVAAFGSANEIDALLNSPAMVSEVSFEANFGTGEIDGTFDAFQGASGESISGSLTLSQGTIANAAMSAQIDGTLSIQGSSNAISGIAVGQFTGATADGIGGALAGTQTSASNTSDLFGIFGATR